MSHGPRGLFKTAAIAALISFAVPLQAVAKNACHAGAAWSLHSSDSQSARAALTPCGQEEPADIISLSCSSGSKQVDVSLDYVAPSGGRKKLPVVMSVDKHRHRFTAELNDVGMYETLDFSLRANHPLLEQLASGSSANSRFAGKRQKIHLKGSGEAVRGMLKACNLMR